MKIKILVLLILFGLAMCYAAIASQPVERGRGEAVPHWQEKIEGMSQRLSAFGHADPGACLLWRRDSARSVRGVTAIGDFVLAMWSENIWKSGFNPRHLESRHPQLITLGLRINLKFGDYYYSRDEQFLNYCQSPLNEHLVKRNRYIWNW
jgi:hypothetical protein